MNYKVDVLHTDKYESIIFDEFCQATLKYPGKFAISLWHLKKEVRNEVRYLTLVAGSKITLTIYYTSNDLPPLPLFISLWNAKCLRLLENHAVIIALILLFIFWTMFCLSWHNQKLAFPAKGKALGILYTINYEM